MSEIIFPEINPNFETKELLGTEEEYRAIKKAAHYSSLVHMIKSPHAYKQNLIRPREATPAMRFGVLAHKAVLEGKDFLSDYIVEPIFRGYTQDGKETTSANAKSVQAAKAEWYAQLRPDQKVVTQEEYDRIGFIMESLLAHKFVQEILKEGRPEVRGQFKDPVTQIGVTFANDFLTFDCNTWVDLKTCADSSDHSFRRSVEERRYDLQCEMYNKGNEMVFGKRPREKVWIAVENQSPYEVRIHFVDPYYEESGAYEFRRCMRLLKECIQSNKWPQSQTVIESLAPSLWFRGHYDLRMSEV